ncbi:ribosomal protein S6 kinase-like 1 [Pectinophora gossypiella]|uniref:ribosomal protein S6 kinase-like 1 n=1 Tax=Pectinophora gossypiella TaxID=13191 RepID=UPI00214EFDCE|nr:ribosomal protein S6 kinase-like 1 [Pectinophora gossypiella]
MSKDKWVRRFSVDETSRHKNGFTIYKITSVLFPIQSPEAMTVVSVWKRYSDVQRLHASMRGLHAGLHLRGTFPTLPKYSFFKRFQQEVIDERAKVIKTVLEFIAEHKLLFTSTDFVNFLQTGYPAPEPPPGGVINAIRSSLQLPVEECAPIEYHTDDEDTRSPLHTARHPNQSTDEIDFISRIPEHHAASVERPRGPSPPSPSAGSLDSIDSDFYNELDKMSVQSTKPMVKKNVLPDLIIFDAPSTSHFEDIHTMNEADNQSTSSNFNTEHSYTRSDSRVSCKSVTTSVVSSTLSNVECKTKTEDSYVFEAGYMLNLAARYEDMKEYARAFECYKGGIEKMLIGVHSDTDSQRRALIKEKTNKYLSYAESLYKNHLCDGEQSLLQEALPRRRLHCPLPACMLRRPYAELALYRVIAVLGSNIMLVLHRAEQTCYAMKVIQKIPNNLTEFDEYFLQNTNETRQPILPTVIPYMVPLHSYIETNNLIFLILAYAPGEKLFDYIKNYAKSIPNTPQREVNLENVFTEPKNKRGDVENENVDSINKVENVKSATDSEISIIANIDEVDTSNNNKTDNYDNMDVSEIVLNSQKLLKNVDKVLSEVSIVGDKPVEEEDVKIQVVSDREEVKVQNVGKVERRVETPPINRAGRVLPAGAVRRWAAQLLTALESLHHCGVLCRDLNPSNILLGEGGQVILTYFTSYSDIEVTLSKLHRPGVMLYVAPELYRYSCERDEVTDVRVCDYWSFGALMYRLLCGVPLSYYHRSVFTSHTILQLPDGLTVEEQSLLTQLLTYEPSERLGAGKDGIEEIKRHPYFKQIDWAQVYDSWTVPE